MPVYVPFADPTYTINLYGYSEAAKVNLFYHSNNPWGIRMVSLYQDDVLVSTFRFDVKCPQYPLDSGYFGFNFGETDPTVFHKYKLKADNGQQSNDFWVKGDLSRYHPLRDSVTPLKLSPPNPFYGRARFYDIYVEELFDWYLAEINNYFYTIKDKFDFRFYVYRLCQPVNTPYDIIDLRKIRAFDVNSNTFVDGNTLLAGSTVYRVKYDKANPETRIKTSSPIFLPFYIDQLNDKFLSMFKGGGLGTPINLLGILAKEGVGPLEIYPGVAGFCSQSQINAKRTDNTTATLSNSLVPFNTSLLFDSDINFINNAKSPSLPELFYDRKMLNRNVKLNKDGGMMDSAFNQVRPSYPMAVTTSTNTLLFIDALRAKAEQKTNDKTFLGEYTVLDETGATFPVDKFCFTNNTYLFMSYSQNKFLVTDENLRVKTYFTLDKIQPAQITGYAGYRFTVQTASTPDFTTYNYEYFSMSDISDLVDVSNYLPADGYQPIQLIYNDNSTYAIKFSYVMGNAKPKSLNSQLFALVGPYQATINSNTVLFNAYRYVALKNASCLNESSVLPVVTNFTYDDWLTYWFGICAGNWRILYGSDVDNPSYSVTVKNTQIDSSCPKSLLYVSPITNIAVEAYAIGIARLFGMLNGKRLPVLVSPPDPIMLGCGQFGNFLLDANNKLISFKTINKDMVCRTDNGPNSTDANNPSDSRSYLGINNCLLTPEYDFIVNPENGGRINQSGINQLPSGKINPRIVLKTATYLNNGVDGVGFLSHSYARDDISTAFDYTVQVPNQPGYVSVLPYDYKPVTTFSNTPNVPAAPATATSPATPAITYPQINLTNLNTLTFVKEPKTFIEQAYGKRRFKRQYDRNMFCGSRKNHIYQLIAAPALSGNQFYKNTDHETIVDTTQGNLENVLIGTPFLSQKDYENYVVQVQNVAIKNQQDKTLTPAPKSISVDFYSNGVAPITWELINAPVGTIMKTNTATTLNSQVVSTDNKITLTVPNIHTPFYLKATDSYMQYKDPSYKTKCNRVQQTRICVWPKTIPLAKFTTISRQVPSTTVVSSFPLQPGNPTLVAIEDPTVFGATTKPTYQNADLFRGMNVTPKILTNGYMTLIHYPPAGQFEMNGALLGDETGSDGTPNLTNSSPTCVVLNEILPDPEHTDFSIFSNYPLQPDPLRTIGFENQKLFRPNGTVERQYSSYFNNCTGSSTLVGLATGKTNLFNFKDNSYYCSNPLISNVITQYSSTIATNPQNLLDINVWDVFVNGTSCSKFFKDNADPSKWSSISYKTKLNLSITGDSSYPHSWHLSDPNVGTLVVNSADSRQATLTFSNTGTVRFYVTDSSNVVFVSPDFKISL